MKSELEQLLLGQHLTEREAEDLLVALTDGSVPPAAVGALLAALRAKGETAEEIRGFATAMRRLARHPQIPVVGNAVDVVGTGGDGSGSLNLSTGAALLAAACGQPVIKHGNRSVSSKSGSADILEQLGLRIPLSEVDAGACFELTGFTFLFAPYYHPSMNALAPIRKSLGVRTVLNFLGPLTNPASPPFYLIGAFSIDAAARMAEALSGLPIERAFVVHGEPGWDEATPVGPFRLFDVRVGSVVEETRDPADYGIERCRPQALKGRDAAWNAEQLRHAFAGAKGAHRDALALGASLALEVTGHSKTLEAGLEEARGAIDGGRASALIDRLSEFSCREKDLEASA